MENQKSIIRNYNFKPFFHKTVKGLVTQGQLKNKDIGQKQVTLLVAVPIQKNKTNNQTAVMAPKPNNSSRIQHFGGFKDE